MADYTKKVLELLFENGCYFVRHGKGSHKTYYSPITKENFTVVNKIEKRHTANGILKDAGINTKV